VVITKFVVVSCYKVCGYVGVTCNQLYIILKFLLLSVNENWFGELRVSRKFRT